MVTVSSTATSIIIVIVVVSVFTLRRYQVIIVCRLHVTASQLPPFTFITGLVHSVNVTVAEALVLHPLLEDRGHITESIRILVPVDKMKQKCFQITTKQIRRSQQF